MRIQIALTSRSWTDLLSTPGMSGRSVSWLLKLPSRFRYAVFTWNRLVPRRECTLDAFYNRQIHRPQLSQTSFIVFFTAEWEKATSTSEGQRRWPRCPQLPSQVDRTLHLQSSLKEKERKKDQEEPSNYSKDSSSHVLICPMTCHLTTRKPLCLRSHPLLMCSHLSASRRKKKRVS